MNDNDNKTNPQKNDLPATEERPDSAGNATILFLGGAMAVCCLLPLLLASGFSLAWLGGSPFAAAFAVAAIAVIGWRLCRRPSCCGKHDQSKDAPPAANPER